MKYWNTKLKNMNEYIPGEQPVDVEEYIKLNSNENPFPPSKKVMDAITQAANDRLRFYPDPDSKKLRAAFAEKNNIQPGNVFIGNGSDEIFSLLFRGFIEHDGLAAFQYPSYSIYYTMSDAFGVKYDKIITEYPFDLDLNRFLEKKYDLVIISSPNNPTGKSCNVRSIREFLEIYKGLLVVDEAYVDFYGNSAIELINDFENVIVTRTFSKSYSLAGLRVGVAIANEDVIKGFFKLKDSYNINRISQAGALAALEDERSFKYNIQMVLNNKEYLEARLAGLDFDIVPSNANFLFVRHPKVKSEIFYRELKKKKILIRYFEGPVQSEFVRIAVGTMMEIKTLAQELESIIKA
jgi:histidinol-phosphate aminotransferase